MDGTFDLQKILVCNLYCAYEEILLTFMVERPTQNLGFLPLRYVGGTRTRVVRVRVLGLIHVG